MGLLTEAEVQAVLVDLLQQVVPDHEVTPDKKAHYLNVSWKMKKWPRCDRERSAIEESKKRILRKHMKASVGATFWKLTNGKFHAGRNILGRISATCFRVDSLIVQNTFL